jgi:hypothetical protein
MASTYVNDLRLNEMATGDASGSWGTVTNTNLELIGEAFSYGTETIGDADSTLTIADGAADAARSFYLKITSSVDLTTTRIVTLGPNTVSKVWMIENATTGSQVITIKQGSGATINVPNGQVKMISTDGAGSGGAVLDLLVDVDLTGTTTLVNLDVSGAVDIAGDLTLSAGGDGALRFTAASSVKVLDNNAAALVFEEADNAYMTFVTTDGSEAVKFDKALDINAATQIDATVTVGVDDTGYDVKFFGATTGKSLLWDESADSLIITGSTSLQGGLEVGVDDTGYDVKFFGATAGAYMLWDESADDLILGGAAGLSVNSTALVTGVLTTTAATVFNGGFASNANSTVGGTLGVTGVVTANAGVVVDNFTLDGTTLALSSGDMLVDVAGTITLDADDAGEIRLKDGGTQYGALKIDSSRFKIQSIISDADMLFAVDDGGSEVTALSFDASEAGAATFSGVVTANAGVVVDNFTLDGTTLALSSGSMTLDSASQIVLDAAGGNFQFSKSGTEFGRIFESGSDFYIYNPIDDKDIKFYGLDGGVSFTALTLDMSAAGNATFNGTVLASNGTPSLPSLSFSSDPNTGIYNSSADNIGFAIGGVARAFMSANQFNMTGNGVFSGSISKGSGSFKIDHPLPEKAETHHLVHSFIEGPQADNIYRGKVALVDGSATVNIDDVAGMTDGTFAVLNREVQCFTSNETGWTAVRGSVSGNILTIEAQDASCTDTISWMVIGERQDKHMYDTEWTDENGKVIVEPLKEK